METKKRFEVVEVDNGYILTVYKDYNRDEYNRVRDELLSFDSRIADLQQNFFNRMKKEEVAVNIDSLATLVEDLADFKEREKPYNKTFVCKSMQEVIEKIKEHTKVV